MGPRVLVIDNYDSFVYNLVQYLGELGADPVVHRHDAVTLDEMRAVEPDAVLISPGPGRPEDAGRSTEAHLVLIDRADLRDACDAWTAWGAHGRVTTLQDISERKKAEEKLRESERMLKRFIVGLLISQNLCREAVEPQSTLLILSQGKVRNRPCDAAIAIRERVNSDKP